MVDAETEKQVLTVTWSGAGVRPIGVAGKIGKKLPKN